MVTRRRRYRARSGVSDPAAFPLVATGRTRLSARLDGVAGAWTGGGPGLTAFECAAAAGAAFKGADAASGRAFVGAAFDRVAAAGEGGRQCRRCGVRFCLCRYSQLKEGDRRNA